LYDTAQGLLIRELSTAKDMDEQVIMEEIESLFAQE
jgi:CarD family transcriptional regulator